MYIYIAAITWVYALLLFRYKLNIVLKLLLVIPLIIFSISRGASGPDTLSYFHKFSDINEIISQHLTFSGEPITYILMYFSSLFEHGWLVFSIIYAITLSLIYCSLLNNYNIYRVFLLTVGPVLLIDGLVNTLRVSLAYFFFLMAYTSRRYWIYWLLAFFSHVSTLILIAGQVFIKKVKFRMSFKNVIVLFMLLGIILLLMSKFDYILSFFPRIQYKLSQYDSFKTQSSLSGLSDIFVIFSLLIFASYYNRMLGIEFFIDFVATISLCIVLYFGAMYSIGFMRILKLLIIVLALSPMLIKSRKPIPDLLLLLVGVLYTLNYLRIILQAENYLPYGVGLN